MPLVTPSYVTGMPLKLRETFMSTTQAIGGRQTGLLFTSLTEGLNKGLLSSNSSLVVKTGLEPATAAFQVRRPNHSATLSSPLPMFASFRTVIYFNVYWRWPVRYWHVHVVVSVSFQVINAGHFWAQKPDSESARKLQMLQENINMYDGRNLEVWSPSYCRGGGC